MNGTLEKAFGYKGDHMNLPVRDLAAALPFYQDALGFTLESQDVKSAVLARDQVRIRLAENGGDPTQDGCAFHVTNVDALFAEFQGKSPGKSLGDVGIEWRGGAEWKRFFVVAPDGLCYWFGERQPQTA